MTTTDPAERLHFRIDRWPINATRKLEGHNDLDAALKEKEPA